MKRIWILAVACLLLCACAAEKPAVQAPTEPPVHYDYEQILRSDMFPGEDPLSPALNEAVQLSDITADGQTLTFTLCAPDISQDLIAWYEANDFDAQAMEAQICTLLKAPGSSVTFHLAYTPHGETVNIAYTDECLEAFGCGLRQFYQYLQNRVYSAMGGADNG